MRIFHWSLAGAFALSYWSAQAGKLQLHSLSGYIIGGLIASRLLWGVWGPRHARFSDFIRSPGTTLRYLEAIAAGHPPRHLGHNPAGGWMVAALLALSLFVTITGLITLAVIDFDGPLLALTYSASDAQAYAVRAAHELAANIILVMIALHLLGVLLASWQHRENLVRAMITGNKEAGEEMLPAVPRPAREWTGPSSSLPSIIDRSLP